MIDLIFRSAYAIIAPDTFNIKSSMSQLPLTKINCSNSIAITNIAVIMAKSTVLLHLFISIGKNNAIGVKAIKFPNIFVMITEKFILECKIIDIIHIFAVSYYTYTDNNKSTILNHFKFSCYITDIEYLKITGVKLYVNTFADLNIVNFKKCCKLL